MYGYVYKTTNLINNKIYIGQHKANKFEPNKYKGSGFLLKEAFKKYGEENFKCELLEWCVDLENLNIKEKYYINLFQSQDPLKGYNLTEGGEGVVSPSQKVRDKMASKKLGTKQSEITKKRKNDKLKKVTHTKEWINKIKKSREGAEMPEGCIEHALEKTKGTHWYNNGVIEERFFPNNVPEGWVKGRIKNTFPHPSTVKRDTKKLIEAAISKTSNSKWYNNDIVETRFKKDDVIPEGFKPGRLKFKKYQ